MKVILASLFVLAFASISYAGPIRGNCANGQCSVSSSSQRTRVRIVERVRSFRFFKGRCR